MVNTYAKSILVLSPDYKPNRGGLAEQSHQVAMGFHRAGWKVTLVTAEGDAQPFDAQQPFAVHRTMPRCHGTLLRKLSAVVRVPSFYRRLRRLIVEAGVSYALATSSPGPLNGLAWGMLAIPKGVSYVGDEVVNLPHCGLFTRMSYRWFTGRMDNIFTCSNFTAQATREALGEPLRPVATGCGISPQDLPPAVDRAEARRRLKLGPGPVLVSVGRLVARKGADMSIRALPAVLKKHPDVTYVVAGGGDELPRLKALAAEMGVQDHVRFEGAFPDELLTCYYCAADIFLMPSRYIPHRSVEGFGIVFLEANHYGIPVIGGRSGGVPDAVAHEESGLLVDPESPPDIAAAVCRLLEDKELYQRLCRRGRQRADEECNWQVVTARYRKPIEDLLEGPAAGGSPR